MTNSHGRWEGGVAATALLASLGLVSGNGTLLLAAAIPLVYVAYGGASSVSPPTDLRAVRRIDSSPTAPGRPVTVELELTNEGERPIADLRVVDGVPDSLAVVEGTPRGGYTLDPDDSTSVAYTVIPHRGEYDFSAPTVRVRGAVGSATTTTAVEAEGDVTLRCALDAGAPPLTDQGTGLVGTLTADTPGRGIEFHSTREYRHGDSASRIDWRQYAKRGTLTTVNYARQLATTVVLVLDARESTRVVAGPGHPTGAELSAYAATRALTNLLRGGHDVAVAVLGLDGAGPAGLSWLPPGTGSEQRRLAIDVFRAAVDAAPVAVGHEKQVQKVVELAPAGAQLALFTPALDDGPVTAVESWSAFDHPLVVCSPDVVAANTVGGQLDQVRRRARLARCQAMGARTIDWRRGTPLQVVLEQAFAASARAGDGAGTLATNGGGH